MISLLVSLGISCLVGYFAGSLMGIKGPWYMNILLGLIGGVVGSVAFSLIGFTASNSIGEIITSIVGACITIFLYRTFSK